MVFSGWHNPYIFAITHYYTPQFLVTVSVWFRALELSHILMFPSQLVFAYLSDWALSGEVTEK